LVTIGERYIIVLNLGDSQTARSTLSAKMTPDELDPILERITQHQQTEQDLEMLRRSLRLTDSVLQSVSQDGKFNTNVGQITGGEVHIGDRIYHGVDAEAINQALRKVLQEKQKAERHRNEKLLLQAVKEEVVARLKQSLHNAVLINLGKEAQPEQVKRPWSSDIKIGDKPSEPIPDNKSTLEVFDQEEIAGKLLILGNPGAGKTTTMLDLAKVLIARAEQDADYPITVLFNLSNWKDDKQPMREWLVAELKSKYGVQKDIGAKWVSDAKLLPMLDGLDELESVRQEPCVQKINKFLQNVSRSQRLVVCSRQEEYERVVRRPLNQESEETSTIQDRRLHLNGAISLQSFTDKQIHTYLERLDQRKLLEYLQDDEDLFKLVKTPLFLWMIVFVVSNKNLYFQDLRRLINSREARLKYIFDTYWEVAITRNLVNQKMNLKGWKSRTYRNKNPPSKRQTQKWLVYLAQQLERDSQTNMEFMIEKLHPNWLLNEVDKQVYNLVIRLTVGLVSGLTAGLYLGGWSHELKILFFAILAGVVTGGISYIFAPILEQFSTFHFNLLFGTIPGLVFFTMTYSFSFTASEYLKNSPSLVLLTGIGVGSVFQGMMTKEIEPVDNLKFSLKRAILYTVFALFLGLIITRTHSILASIFSWKNSIQGFYILLCFLLVILLVGAISGEESRIDLKIYPNQGIWRTWNYVVIWFLISGFIAGIFTVVMDGYELIRTPAIALTVAFLCSLIGSSWSGLVCIQHFILRFILYLKGYIPWNYAKFLDYSTERLLLQRVGGRYRFIHRLLQEYLATMPLER